MQRQNKKSRPLLLVGIGAPGSGKSYFAEKLCKEYGLIHLKSDEIRDRLFPKPTFSPEENSRLFSFIDFLAEKLVASGVSVFYDSNASLKEYRFKLQRVAKRHKARYAVVWIKTPLALAINRAELRNYNRVGRHVVVGMHKEIEHPTKEPVIVINGTKPYTTQKKAFMEYFGK